MRFTIAFFLAATILASLGFAHAQSTDDSLRIYAVNIIQDPPQSWTGYGIYLGKGLVITAQHVVGSASQTKPSVRIAGMDLPAKAIREGNFERVDLTLLSIDEQKLPIYLQMRRMPLCEKPPWPGEPVIVAIPEGTARSRIMSPLLLPFDVRRRFPTVIRDVATTGNSGSGVFDAGSKCLLGIMSRKLFVRSNDADAGSEQKDIAKYFVPASAIRTFIPANYRFKVSRPSSRTGATDHHWKAVITIFSSQPPPLANCIGGRSYFGSDLNSCSKYSMVFINPSRSCTRGTQPSRSLAKLMSGQRCLGSSSGSGR